MKHFIKFIISIIFISTISCSSCQKSSINDNFISDSSNVTLYNQPLNVIQKFITGNWKLIYTDGGFVATKMYYDSTFWQLSTTKIIQISPFNAGGVFIDTTITWVREMGTYTNGNYTYILHCFDRRNYEYEYAIMQMYNDTLIIHENGIDGLYYHFIKNN